MRLTSRLHSLHGLLFLGLASMAFLVTAALGYVVLYRDYRNFQEESERLRKELTDAEKTQVKQEIEKVFDYIRYSHSRAEERLRESVRSRLEEAHGIAGHLYEEYKGKMPPAAVRTLIKDALRPIRFDEGRGYYFATGLDGVEILFADHPELEGRNLLDLRDTQGAYVIRDMIDLVRRQGGGFYRYTWTKPNEAGKDFPKVAYLKFFAPFHGFLGTGGYLDDMESNIQREVLERIRKIRFGKDGYVFVLRSDGVMLVHDVMPELMGKDVVDMTDSHGVKIFREQLRAAENPEGGFVAYQWQNPTTKRDAPKISFVKKYAPWGWILGAGVYLDDIEARILARQRELREKTRAAYVLLASVFLGILALALAFSFLLSRYMKMELESFLSFFEKMKSGGEPIRAEWRQLSEFERLADSANRMLEERRRAEEALRESEARLRKAEVVSQSGNWEFDFNAGMVRASEGARAIYGLKNPPWSIPEIQKIPLPECRPLLDEAMRRLRQEGAPYDVEFRIRRSDGQVLDIRSIAEYDRERNVVFGVIQDITARKKMERDIQEREEWYRILLQTSPDPIVVYDLQGNFLSASLQAARIYGSESVEDFLREVRTIADLLGEPDRTRALDHFRITLEQGVSRQTEYTIRLKDGTPLLGEVHSSVVHDAQGRPQAFMSVIRDITERRRAEEALRRQEATFRALAENSVDVIMRFDRDLRHLYVNPAVERETGLPPGAFLGKTHEELGFPEDLCRLWGEAIRKVFDTGKIGKLEFQLPSGFWIDWLLMPETGPGGRVEAVITSARDITERKRLEGQLMQAQKMESVGRLAGGVAHDFNNLLTGILGNLSLALMDLSPQDPLHETLNEVSRAAESAAALTRQLLAFSRKQIVEPRVLDLNEAVARIQKMLRRLIGEDILLEIRPSEPLGRVKIDPGQLEQILVNLAVNARDAMPGGGTLTLSTGDADLDEAFCRERPGLMPGAYVLLTVSDTGIGMSEEVKAHLFEPFFTTKEKGKGTGLGLATIYGTVRQSNGHVEADSAPGAGTTFRIYLPRVDALPDAERRAARGDLPTGTETVVLVEDEKIVRDLAERVLKRQGYRVRAYPDGGEALFALETADAPVHLLITDVVMPGLNGRELAEKVKARFPEIRVIFASGYTEDIIARHGVLEEGLEFIAKPYSPQDLARKVREVLDGKGPGARA